jgi:hypothetical protein
MYIRAPPNYMVDKAALDEEPGDELWNLQRAMLHDVMLSAGGAGHDSVSGYAPSPYELMHAKRESVVVPPAEALALNLAIAADALPPSRTSDAEKPTVPTVAGSPGGNSRGTQRVSVETARADGTVRQRRHRPRPRKSVP